MKYRILILASALLCSTSLMAQEKKQLIPQQQRMAECSSKAKGLKGDEYKKARNACLKGEALAKSDKAASKARSPQQQKMAECSSKAKGLKGDAYTKARNDCLKG
jgi:hypothetical protein